MLLTLVGKHPSERDRPVVWNHAMHWGTGVVVGALRGVWALIGLRGPQANTAFAVLRLATDQTLENASGVGAPPATWPRQELLIDIAHKAIYALATGMAADRLVQPRLVSRRGAHSH
jgi:hypothetical protein